MKKNSVIAVIVAAGIGKRVGADIPKQYLKLLDKTILEHSINAFINHELINELYVVIAKNDQWFTQMSVASHPKLKKVFGGKERVDSVLLALKSINNECFVLVHDGARPCVKRSDIDKLISQVLSSQQGAILASRVRDTMKRSDQNNQIIATESRDNLWHALTPQMFLNRELIAAIESNSDPKLITDEASAIEMAGGVVQIVEGRSDNLKVTRSEDLKLAEFYLRGEQ